MLMKLTANCLVVPGFDRQGLPDTDLDALPACLRHMAEGKIESTSLH